MVQVRMRDKHMIDADHFLDGQAPYTRTGIDQNIVIDEERVKVWLAKGAQPTETVRKLLKTQGIDPNG